jgi:peptide/nickel transport system ATP-binding protein
MADKSKTTDKGKTEDKGKIEDKVKTGDKEGFVLRVKNLTKTYTSGLVRTKTVVGAKNVSFDLKRGEIISLAGESGSGKTTVAKMILRLIEPTSGSILFDGKDIKSYNIKDYYRLVQAIFQDPYSAFNPFYRVDHVLDKAFVLREDNLTPEKKKKIIWSTLKSIGLNPDEVLGRYPHQLSGGQMQRILIGRSLLIGSQLLIADEPTSMIDASTRAGILNLLLTLRKERGLSVLFITHDIGQAQYLSDRVLVMKKGEVVEQGTVDEVFIKPKHPYTKELLAAVPSLYERWEDFA